VHSLPVLGRSQLHHGNDANARRRVHLDNMRPLREYAYWFGIFATRLGYASPDYRRMARPVERAVLYENVSVNLLPQPGLLQLSRKGLPDSDSLRHALAMLEHARQSLQTCAIGLKPLR
jgi:hypothetical protein